jgi:hypothetical protein
VRCLAAKETFKPDSKIVSLLFCRIKKGKGLAQGS